MHGDGEMHGDGATPSTIDQAVAPDTRTVTDTSREPGESNELKELYTLDDLGTSDTRKTLSTSEYSEILDNSSISSSGNFGILTDPETLGYLESPNSARSDNIETLKSPDTSEDRNKPSHLNSLETLHKDVLQTPDTYDKLESLCNLETDIFETSNIEHICPRCHSCEDKPITVKKLMAAAGIGNTFSNFL